MKLRYGESDPSLVQAECLMFGRLAHMEDALATNIELAQELLADVVLASGDIQQILE